MITAKLTEEFGVYQADPSKGRGAIKESFVKSPQAQRRYERIDLLGANALSRVGMRDQATE